MALQRISGRTLMLMGLAIVMVCLTLYDTLVGLPDRNGRTAAQSGKAGTVDVPAPHRLAPDAGNILSIAELQNILKHGEVIRQRYRTVAVPYAEAVASFATLYAPGEIPKDKAATAIRSLVPPQVEIKDMLISEVSSATGSLWLTATLSLSGSDSSAMIAALVALGDAANGV